MELSSHALDMHRVNGVRFDTAVFTNLTRDHLDHHGTLEAYGDAKAKLFTWPALKHAVINVDDVFGARLAERSSAATLTTYSRRSRASSATRARALVATEVVSTARGLQICVDGAWGAAVLNSRFVGEFNVENLLASLATLLGWDVPMSDAVRALEECVAPPGRMETFSAGSSPLVVVDYAHTPDALEKALGAARAHCSGKLVCVFGCGGDRDPGKRPMMGAIAERLADQVVVTDDNPRTEDGDAIVANILRGFREPQHALVERDRARAIAVAVEGAASGDVVVIAGKGHEDYQIIGTQSRHFSDREVAQTALRRYS
jgi:UDP-N-acetylmuramoyl-L-alanyl-D-glutamate--2,6-diaminopimelate ligase